MATIKRPIFVTVISWIFIVSSIISFLSNTFMLITNNPMTIEIMELNIIPINIQFIMIYLGLTIMLTSGIGMLKGYNWARLLFVIWSGISYIIGFITSPFKLMLIPYVVLFAIIIFFLFRPKVNKFFNSQ